MAQNRKPDFAGYATKAGLKCSDGRTIMPAAFQHMDGAKIPLVWQHLRDDPENVLGHALLEARQDGMYAYGYFNKTQKAQAAKESVEHEDVDSLSIFANQLVERSKQVTHGVIREVSLVLAGANPGAKIDYINIQHGDGSTDVSDEDAIIRMNLQLDEVQHSDPEDEGEEDDETDEEDETDGDDDLEHALDDMKIGEILDGMSTEEQNVVSYLVGLALNSVSPDAQHSDKSAEGGDLTHKEGADEMSRNVFDQNAATKETKENELTHDAIKGIVEDAVRLGSLRAAAKNYALQHGVENIDVLFPDAKPATGVIELEKRRTEWVASVLNGTRHTPFSRIKTFTADLTQEEARAKGYVTGNYKLEEWIGVTTRTTSPTTVYKKQKLDRDDILDITDFDIVAFLKAEMRLMIEEEIARAILIGDGRSAASADKIKDPQGGNEGTGIRSILNDHELFVTTVYVNVDDADPAGLGYEEVVDAVMDGMEFYKGTGTPSFYTTIPQINKFLKSRDQMGRRYYRNKQEVADALGVSAIYNVEPMKEIDDLIGIIVNLDDYNVGTDRGGELNMFDDFDIDYNQEKYLLETRMSGALVRPKSAIVIRMVPAADVLAKPVKPQFDSSTGVITIPTVTGVVYKDGAGVTLTAGAQTALAAGANTTVYAVPASGYFFSDNQQDSWYFKRPAA